MSKVVPKELPSTFVDIWNDSNTTRELPNELHINYGWCYQFALILYTINPRSTIYHCSCHAWIKVGSKYYDSCNPNGTKNVWVMCPHGHDIYKVSAEELENYWNSHGRSGPVVWRVIDKTVKWHKRNCA